MKTVHGPDAHVTKKQRNDVHLRALLLKENGDPEAGTEPGGQRSEESAEASSTSQSAEDCLHVKAIKTESSGVSRVGSGGPVPQEATPSRPGPFQSTAWGPAPHLQLGTLPGPSLSTPRCASFLQLNCPPFTAVGLTEALWQVPWCWAGCGQWSACPHVASLRGAEWLPVSAF